MVLQARAAPDTRIQAMIDILIVSDGRLTIDPARRGLGIAQMFGRVAILMS